jgi:hypothetical protein
MSTFKYSGIFTKYLKKIQQKDFYIYILYDIIDLIIKILYNNIKLKEGDKGYVCKGFGC